MPLSSPPLLPTDPQHFAGRHVLVTGASRGIGWAVAKAFAAAGASLSLVGRDAASLQQRAAEITGPQNSATLQNSVRAFAADVADEAAIGKAINDAQAAQGPLDILVNNAGFGASKPFAKMDTGHWREMLNVNLDGVFFATRAAIPGLLSRPQARVITIASTAGLTGYGYVAAYCAAKHGAVGLMRALAREYAKRDITFNAVCPGYVDTEMTETSIRTIVEKTGRSREQALAELTAGNPQGRLVKPEEVAATVLWLAMPAAGAVTGQAIAVAGGEVM
ncbi:SDR family NAD(P)-dependent oxidoreductase [Ferrovibrio sp.]|uniref:SDR family NAD(P)-dependent oxidoreductase n=1 Tax=Ferrovibrio sp. TaxID=1917215 RepID=UPI0035B2E629